jgi:hypothetical protein
MGSSLRQLDQCCTLNCFSPRFAPQFRYFFDHRFFFGAQRPASEFKFTDAIPFNVNCDTAGGECLAT